MKGLSIRLEDEVHRRLKRVILEKEVTVQGFAYRLLEAGIEKAEKELGLEVGRE